MKVRVKILEMVEGNDGNDWWTVERVEKTDDPYTDCQNLYPPYFYDAVSSPESGEVNVGDIIDVQEGDLS